MLKLILIPLFLLISCQSSNQDKSKEVFEKIYGNFLVNYSKAVKESDLPKQLLEDVRVVSDSALSLAESSTDNRSKSATNISNELKAMELPDGHQAAIKNIAEKLSNIDQGSSQKKARKVATQVCIFLNRIIEMPPQ